MSYRRDGTVRGQESAYLSRHHCCSAGFIHVECSGSRGSRQQMKKPSNTAGAPSSRKSHCTPTKFQQFLSWKVGYAAPEPVLVLLLRVDTPKEALHAMRAPVLHVPPACAEASAVQCLRRLAHVLPKAAKRLQGPGVAGRGTQGLACHPRRPATPLSISRQAAMGPPRTLATAVAMATVA